MAHIPPTQTPSSNCARRLLALSALARQRIETPSAPTAADFTAGKTPLNAPIVGAARRHARPVLWRIVLAFVVLLGAVGGVSGAWLRGRGQPTATPTPGPAVSSVVKSVPFANGLDCPHDVAWSPTGAEIALLGYQLDCPSADPAFSHYPGGTDFSPAYTLPLFQRKPGLVTIYDTGPGTLKAQLHPDAAIRSKIPVPPAVQSAYQDTNLGLNYTHVLWSPDGQRLAVTFEIYVPAAPRDPNRTGQDLPPGTAYDGVLLASSIGVPQQVLVHPIDAQQPTFTVVGPEGPALQGWG